MVSAMCAIGEHAVYKDSGWLMSDTLQDDEAISALDRVRRAAYTNDKAKLESKPPLLLSDSLLSESFFLYQNSRRDENFAKGSNRVHAIGDIKVAGGAILEVRNVILPVVLLYSERQKVAIAHACNTPMAALEADFHDTAYCDDHAWESIVAGDAIREVMQWRKDAAAKTLSAGLKNTPEFLMDDLEVHVVRYGVGAWMSLRSPNNQAEYSSVKSAVKNMLSSLPMASQSTLECMLHCRDVTTSVILETRKSVDVPMETTRPSEGLLEQMTEEVCGRSIITWCASVVLHCAVDDGVDANGEHINEFVTAATYNRAVTRDASKEEKQWLAGLKLQPEQPKLASFYDTGFTLPGVMEGMNRPYTVKQICSTEDMTKKQVLEAIANAIFKREDASVAIGACHAMVNENMTLHSVAMTLASCLAAHQAIVVASRDTDGRFASVRLVAKDTEPRRLNKQSLSRATMFPWLRVLIVDRYRVSELLVKPPNDMHGSLIREELKVHDDERPRPVASTLDNQDTSALTAQIAQMSKKMEELERKLDAALVAQNTTPMEPLTPAASPPPLDIQDAHPDTSIVSALKRTLVVLEGFAKRARA